MVTRFVTCILIAAGAQAGSFEVGVSTTSTQAVLHYSAPSDGVCMVEVVESQSGVGVNDVNPTLFPGSNLDSRVGGAISSVRDRIFIAGKRAAEKAADQRFYSRALQAYTAHRFTVTCGGDATTGTFVTSNPPIGNTNPELPGWSADALGNWAWPQLDWKNRSAEYIDPLTGILLKRMTAPGDMGLKQSSSFAAAWSPGGQWANTNNAISTSALATVTNSTAPLFLATGKITVDYTDAASFNTYAWGIDDILEHAFGGGTASNATDRTFEVCLTVDSGQTCSSSSISLVAPRNSGGEISSPGGFPAAPFQRWGTMTLARNQISTPFGKVNVSGTTVTLQSFAVSSYFSLDWAPGTKVLIQGSSPTCASDLCTIAEVKSSSQLKIVESLNVTNADYSAANFGVRIRKTTATGSLSLRMSYDLAASRFFQTTSNGSGNFCSSKSDATNVTAGGAALTKPVEGYLCIVPTTTGQSVLYFLIPSTGEVRLLSQLYKPFTGGSAGDEHGGNMNVNPSSFDPNDSRAFYGSVETGGNPTYYKTIWRGRYQGDYRAWNPNYTLPPPSDNVTWTNLTKASEMRDVGRQLVAANPKYNPQLFQFLSGVGVLGQHFIFVASSQQDAPCIVAFFDLQTGLITGSVDSWSQYPGRWGTCHTIQANGTGDWMLAAINPARDVNPSVPLQGPFRLQITQVQKNGVWNDDTSLTENDGSTCPQDLAPQWKMMGATGNNCIQVRTAGEPCSLTPTAAEKSLFPCPHSTTGSMLQTMEEGDVISDFTTNVQHERLRIVRKRAINANSIELVLQRKAFCTEGLPATFFRHPNGWSAHMITEASCWAGGWWHRTDAQGTWVLEDPLLTASHNDVGVAVNDGEFTSVTGGYKARSMPVPEQVRKPFSVRMEAWPTFAGSQALIRGDGFIETYPSMRQWAAPPSERRWALDLRAYQAGLGLGAESPLTLFGNTVTLVSGTTQVYKISNPVAGYDRKRLPFLAWAGYHWLHDVSGPGSLLEDSNVYSFCVASLVGECRPGSAVNDSFVNVPKASLTSQTCVTNHYASNFPCFVTASPVGGWAVQWDTTRNDPKGVNFRRLTMGLSGPGRQYTFANAHSTPDGKWAIIPGYWLDGYRMDLMLAKLPPWPAEDMVDRSTFVPVPVTLKAVDGVSSAQVRFGYAENGAPTDFYCTTRREACLTSASTTEPFLYAGEAPQRQSCSTGCTIQIPGLSGRILYYQVEHLDVAGNIVQVQPLAAVAVP